MPVFADDETKDVALHGNDSVSTDPKPITYTEASGKRRLDVNAAITGEVTLASSLPRWDYSATSVGLTNGVDYDVLTIGPGVTGFVDFIQIICKNSNYEIAIEIDGTEQLRISQGDLGTIGLLNSNSTTVPLYAASASKIFTVHPNQPFHFADELHVIVQAQAAGNNIDGFMVTWREQP
jgi:hypothetical protein